MRGIGQVLVLTFVIIMGTGARAMTPTVVLDVGHSLAQPGAISPGGRTEFAYNERLASRVSAELDKQGISVLRVATDGRNIPLSQRTASTGGAALFVSIHHDSIQQSWIDQGWRRRFRGYSIFVSGRNPYYAASFECAQRLGDRLRAAGESPSLYHAIPVVGENRPLLDKENGVHRYDGLAVLRTAKSPALLIEAGVIANPDEELRLGRNDVVERIAEAISVGVALCIAQT